MSEDQTHAAEAAEAEEAVASPAETSDQDGAKGEAEQAEAPAAEEAGEDGETGEKPETPEDDDAPRKRKNRRPAHERIAELTRQKRELEDRARRAEDALAKAKPPRFEDFDTDEAFEEAKAEFYGYRRDAKTARNEAAKTAERIEQAAAADYQAAAAQFTKIAPDYERVAHFAPISDNVASAIMRMGEDGPAVAYALGKNHDLARQISALDPTSAAIELGRIAATTQRAPRKTVSKAPPPVKPAVDGGGPATPDPDKMSYAEYRRWRMGS